MKHKQQIEFVKRKIQEEKTMTLVDEYLRNQLSCILLILGDKFGFGKKRMTDFLDHLANYTLSYKNDAKVGIITRASDIEQLLKDEYKLDMNEVITMITEKNKLD